MNSNDPKNGQKMIVIDAKFLDTKTVKRKSEPKRNKTIKQSSSNQDKQLLKFVREKQHQLLNSVVNNEPAGSSNVGLTDFNKSFQSMNQWIQKKTVPSSSSPPVAAPQRPTTTPSYGCLKGGSLPTFRELKNKTIKNDVHSRRTDFTADQPAFVDSIPHLTPSLSFGPDSFDSGPSSSSLPLSGSELFQHAEHRKISTPYALPAQTQKRTLKKTFHVGKNPKQLKVGVLVSNKTIRSNTMQRKKKINETTIGEVKSFLIKRGLIKAGSDAPQDVLRKMYESASMIQGDIYNYSSENLLHNFLNDK
jgi:hypothetical protein